MKITKTNISLLTITAITFASFGMVFAENHILPINTNLGVTTSTQTNVGSNTINADTNTNVSEDNDKEIKNNQKGDDFQSDTNKNKQDDENSDQDDNDTKISVSHRSNVASFIRNILKLAEKEKGIGAQIKVIAKEQSDSNEKTSDAIIKIENRGQFKTFLIGTDYKNIGTLRSEMVKTDGQIKKLQALISKTTDINDSAVLNVQIQLLLNEQAKIKAFITANENKFSLFGWFLKNK